MFKIKLEDSFEGIIHSRGHNSWETQTKTTGFVMRHY